MRRHDLTAYTKNLGADTQLGADVPTAPVPSFFEKNKTAIIVGGGAIAIAIAAAFAIHHAKSKKQVKRNSAKSRKNPRSLQRNMYMPSQLGDYVKQQAKMLPHHLAYARGAMGH